MIQLTTTLLEILNRAFKPTKNKSKNSKLEDKELKKATNCKTKKKSLILKEKNQKNPKILKQKTIDLTLPNILFPN